MSASQTPGAAGAPPANDPSMEDILASIRRILSEEEPAAAAPATPEEEVTAVEPRAAEPPAPDEKPDDVLVLDPSMLVEEEELVAAPSPPPTAAPTPPAPMTAAPSMGSMGPAEFVSKASLLAPETEAAATTSVSSLMRMLATERTMQVHRGGPTIEDIVREEMRPLLKQWLDANLPDLVERLVQAEIERVVHRAVP
jgi:uncharacterized protein